MVSTAASQVKSSIASHHRALESILIPVIGDALSVLYTLLLVRQRVLALPHWFTPQSIPRSITVFRHMSLIMFCGEDVLSQLRPEERTRQPLLHPHMELEQRYDPPFPAGG
jgi:hypothetical protein